MGDSKIVFSKICRVCMKCRKLTPIFGVTTDSDDFLACSKDYSIAIKRYAAVGVSKEDGLPQNICYGCIALLNSITYFKNLCENSYTVLQDIYRRQLADLAPKCSKNSDMRPLEVFIKNEEYDCNRQTSQPYIQTNIKKTINKIEMEIDTKKSCVKVENDNIDYDNSSLDGNENDTTFDTNDDTVNKLAPTKSKTLSETKIKTLIQTYQAKRMTDQIIKNARKREKSIQRSLREREIIRNIERQKKMIERENNVDQNVDDLQKEKVLKDMIVKLGDNKQRKRQWSSDMVQKYEAMFRIVKENIRRQGSVGERVTNLLQCLECNTTLQESSARGHFQKHLGHKYICEHCGHGFHIQKEMDRHCMARHGKKKTFACELCSYETPYKNEFKVHERTHTGERPYTCDICGRTFYKKQVLTKHVVLHSNVRPFQCQYCQKDFSSKGLVQSHINSIHHRRYVYKCTECNVTYAKVTTVRKHLVASHRVPRDKQGKCEFCERAFKSKSDMQAHIKYHHLRQHVYKCYECGATYASSKSVQRHLRIFHRIPRDLQGKVETVPMASLPGQMCRYVGQQLDDK